MYTTRRRGGRALLADRRDGRLRGALRRRRPAGAASSAKCFGKQGDDLLERASTSPGTSRDDVIVAGRGQRSGSTAAPARDLICADGGNDRVDGGNGRDRIDGDQGDDHLDGGDDADLITGNRGDDVISGGANAGDTRRRLTGGSGDDLIRGGDGRDVLKDGPGRRRGRGDGGDDVCQPAGRPHARSLRGRRRHRRDRLRHATTRQLVRRGHGLARRGRQRRRQLPAAVRGRQR